VGNFYTDVIQKEPRFQSAARVADLALLEPITRQLVQQIVDSAQKMGISLMVFETYRSQARQQELFNNGATKLRAVGVHHYGLACDIVRSVGGEPSWKGDFSFLGQLAHSSGLIWGGDWGDPSIHHSFVDPVHVQRCTIARQPALFAGTWYPDDSYNPYTDDPHLLLAATVSPKPAGSKSAGGQPRSQGRSHNKLLSECSAARPMFSLRIATPCRVRCFLRSIVSCKDAQPWLDKIVILKFPLLAVLFSSVLL